MTLSQGITLLAERLAEADAVTVLTGAGVSVASGVPTFRGEEGLWRKYHPEDLATVEAFSRDPRLVWEWYDWRRQRIAACEPNPAHQVLADWSRRFRQFTLVTQNVDGLHERAGTRNVIRFHGSIWRVRCARGCAASPPEWDELTVPLPELPPRCPYCHGLVRPAVVWFGEPLDAEALDRATAAVRCEVFLAIGTSAVVFPAATLIYSARQYGAFAVEINPESTPASTQVDLALRGPAEELLPEIDRQLARRPRRRRPPPPSST